MRTPRMFSAANQLFALCLPVWVISRYSRARSRSLSLSLSLALFSLAITFSTLFTSAFCVVWQ